jgi:hypothetical protein
MFMITLPQTTKIGDTVDVKINAKPERLTYRDKDTLSYDGNNYKIVKKNRVGDLIRYVCADADGTADFTIIE